ncbi:MAG: hypothetical protein QXZ70_01110 [Candidatus Bathyarchaeia archaeon]
MQSSTSWHHPKRMLLVAALLLRLFLFATIPIAYASSGADQQSANYGLIALVVAIGAVTLAGIIGGIRYGRSRRGYEGKPLGSLRKHSKPTRNNLPKSRDHKSTRKLRGYR